MLDNYKIAVVIPCYRVREKIIGVLSRIESYVDFIYVIDDGCPDSTGEFVSKVFDDSRLRVLFHPINQGVGAAVVTGYNKAAEDGNDIIVKIDGDGQMRPELIKLFVKPIINSDADYTKGNRFFSPRSIAPMPTPRLFGNAVLSFMSKLSTGYWRIFDPTNGYTAISSVLVPHLQTSKLAKRFFFESDLLFRLNLIDAKVVDIPMQAVYEDEKSNLRILNSLPIFVWGNAKNLSKRILYNYFIRDFSIGSIQLVSGIFSLVFGLWFGFNSWAASDASGIPSTPGAVMITGISIILGVQLLLSFLMFDISRTPARSISKYISYLSIAEENPKE